MGKDTNPEWPEATRQSDILASLLPFPSIILTPGRRHSLTDLHSCVTGDPFVSYRSGLTSSGGHAADVTLLRRYEMSSLINRERQGPSASVTVRRNQFYTLPRLLDRHRADNKLNNRRMSGLSRADAVKLLTESQTLKDLLSLKQTSA